MFRDLAISATKPGQATEDAEREAAPSLAGSAGLICSTGTGTPVQVVAAPRVTLCGGHAATYAAAISARISSTRQAVVRGPSFTGFGYFPDLQPFNHVDLLTGMTPKTAGSRTKPVSGNDCAVFAMIRTPWAWLIMSA